MLKEKISTDHQSIVIEADVPTVSAKKWQTKPTPDHVPHTVPDNRTRCGCEYNDDDVDLTGSGGKECSANKDRLSGERHAGTFERNDAKDDPWAVDWDQANQGIGQRSILHLLKGRPKPSLNYHCTSCGADHTHGRQYIGVHGSRRSSHSRVRSSTTPTAASLHNV